MSIETLLSELKMSIINLTEVMYKTQQALESKTIEPKPTKAQEPKPTKAQESKPTKAPVEPVISKQGEFLCNKATILEIAKTKLSEQKATKEEIKAIISQQGFDSLNDIQNQSDFDAIYKQISEL